MNNIFLTQAEVIRKRGWSQTMIDKFMPKPCRLETNYVNPYFPKMKLYNLRRIRVIEQTEKFMEAMLEKERRSALIRRRKLEKEFGF